MQLITDIKQNKIQFVTCHRLPHRSFFFRGKQFPVCARCTGIYLGYYLSLPFFLIEFSSFSLLMSIILILFTFVDGLIQHYSRWESNNYIRLVTGIICGVGLMSLSAFIGKFLGTIIIHLIGLK